MAPSDPRIPRVTACCGVLVVAYLLLRYSQGHIPLWSLLWSFGNLGWAFLLIWKGGWKDSSHSMGYLGLLLSCVWHLMALNA